MSVHYSAQSSDCISLRTIQAPLLSSTEDSCCCTTETSLCSFHNLPHVCFPRQLSESNCIPLCYLHDLSQDFASSYQDGFLFPYFVLLQLTFSWFTITLEKIPLEFISAALLNCMRELFTTVTIRQSQIVAKRFSSSSVYTYFSFSMREKMKIPTQAEIFTIYWWFVLKHRDIISGLAFAQSRALHSGSVTLEN